jgi:hypothetical protein
MRRVWRKDRGEIQQGSCGGIIGKPTIWVIRSGAKQGQGQKMRVRAATVCGKWRVLTGSFRDSDEGRPKVSDDWETRNDPIVLAGYAPADNHPFPPSRSGLGG